MSYTVLKLPQVIARTGLSRSTIYRKAGNGQDAFPKPIKTAARASGWLETEIDAYLSAQVAQSRAEAQ